MLPGYNVLLTKHLLDESVSNALPSPSKEICNLIHVFYSRDKLAIQMHVVIESMLDWMSIFLLHASISIGKYDMFVGLGQVTSLMLLCDNMFCFVVMYLSVTYVSVMIMCMLVGEIC